MNNKIKAILIAVCVFVLAFCVIGCEGVSNVGEVHEWGEWTVKTNATCTEEGVLERVCSDCGKKELTPIAALGHDWVKSEDSSREICQRCEVIKGEEPTEESTSTSESDSEESIESTETSGSEESVESTETNDSASESNSESSGETSESTSESTSDFSSESEAVHVHNFAEIVKNEFLKSKATCVDKAVYYKSCSVCGEVNYDETFENGEALGHYYGEKEIDRSQTLVLTDEEYDRMRSAGKLILLDGGIFTCDESVKTYAVLACERCGETNLSVRIAKNHTETSVRYNVVEPTCYSAGSYENKCKVCNVTFKFMLDKKQHNYSLNAEFVSTDDGLYKYSAECSTCTAEQSGAEHYINATVDAIMEVKATCQSIGEIIFTVDGTEIRIKTADKLDGHVIAVRDEDGEYVVVTPETVLNYNTYKNNIVCILDDEERNVSCRYAVKGLYTCITCGYAGTVKLIGDHTPTKAPDGNELITRVEPTCTENGYDEFDCGVCGQKQREIIPALGHQYAYKIENNRLIGTCRFNPEHHDVIDCDEIKVEIISSTCKERGRKTYLCYKNGEVFITVIEDLPLLNTHCHKVNGKDVPVVGPLKITAEDYGKDGWLLILDEGEKYLCSKEKEVKAILKCSLCENHVTVVVYADHIADSDGKSCLRCGEEI